MQVLVMRYYFGIVGAAMVWMIVWLSSWGPVVPLRREGRRDGCGFPFLRGLWILVMLSALYVVLPWSGPAMADVKLAMSRKPPPDPIKLGAPALSPDGRLAALGVSFERGYSHLAIFDIHREELQVIGKPDDEGWRDPSFSPSGDRIVFIQYCTGCDRKGFQISIYDLETGTATTLTEGSERFRDDPIFSPDGQSIIHHSKDLEWEGDEITFSGFENLRRLIIASRQDREIVLDLFGVRGFRSLIPSGFLDDGTLIFAARSPYMFYSDNRNPWLDKLGMLAGKTDAGYRYFGYRLKIGWNLGFISPDAPRRIGPTHSLSVSTDTGRMVFIGKSGHAPENPLYLGYDVFLGDGETFRQMTSLYTHMVGTTISKSGNRVAFLADETRRQHWSLWVYDVGTRRVWETNLKRRLQAWRDSAGGH